MLRHIETQQMAARTNGTGTEGLASFRMSKPTNGTLALMITISSPIATTTSLFCLSENHSVLNGETRTYFLIACVHSRKKVEYEKKHIRNVLPSEVLNILCQECIASPKSSSVGPSLSFSPWLPVTLPRGYKGANDL